MHLFQNGSGRLQTDFGTDRSVWLIWNCITYTDPELCILLLHQNRYRFAAVGIFFNVGKQIVKYPPQIFDIHADFPLRRQNRLDPKAVHLQQCAVLAENLFQQDLSLIAFHLHWQFLPAKYQKILKQLIRHGFQLQCLLLADMQILFQGLF